MLWRAPWNASGHWVEAVQVPDRLHPTRSDCIGSLSAEHRDRPGGLPLRIVRPARHQTRNTTPTSYRPVARGNTTGSSPAPAVARPRLSKSISSHWTRSFWRIFMIAQISPASISTPQRPWYPMFIIFDSFRFMYSPRSAVPADSDPSPQAWSAESIGIQYPPVSPARNSGSKAHSGIAQPPQCLHCSKVKEKDGRGEKTRTDDSRLERLVRRQVPRLSLLAPKKQEYATDHDRPHASPNRDVDRLLFRYR